MNFFKHLLLAVTSFSLANLVSAQNWEDAYDTPGATWPSVACSADGTKLVGVTTGNSPYDFPPFGPGPIYTSTNSGATWLEVSNSPMDQWTAVVSSADGATLTAITDTGNIYTSSDSGMTWKVTNAPSAFLVSLACSADGRKLIAGAWDDYVGSQSWLYISTDSGATWKVAKGALTGYWESVASAADGSRLVAANVHAGEIYTSTNSGTTWKVATNAPSGYCQALASSSDGTKLVAAISGGFIYLSTNSGATWQQSTAPVAQWQSVASSADGTRLAAVVAYGGPVFTSTNSGATWTLNDAPNESWQSVASSADGNELAAVSFQGSVYIGHTTPTPNLNITRSHNNVMLTWGVPSIDFVVQQNSDLTKTNWTTVGGRPFLNLNNLQYQFAIPSSTGNTFYRLKTP